jgi:hypothetical protein
VITFVEQQHLPHPNKSAMDCREWVTAVSGIIEVTTTNGLLLSSILSCLKVTLKVEIAPFY